MNRNLLSSNIAFDASILEHPQRGHAPARKAETLTEPLH
jgi:hypothetical protein